MEAARHFPHVQRLHFDPEQILGFTQMPDPIWTDPSVSDLDVRVHGYLVCWLRLHPGRFPTACEIAAALIRAECTVRRAIQSLERAGYLILERCGKKSRYKASMGYRLKRPGPKLASPGPLDRQGTLFPKGGENLEERVDVEPVGAQTCAQTCAPPINTEREKDKDKLAGTREEVRPSDLPQEQTPEPTEPVTDAEYGKYLYDRARGFLKGVKADLVALAIIRFGTMAVDRALDKAEQRNPVAEYWGFVEVILANWEREEKLGDAKPSKGKPLYQNSIDPATRHVALTQAEVPADGLPEAIAEIRAGGRMARLWQSNLLSWIAKGLVEPGDVPPDVLLPIAGSTGRGLGRQTFPPGRLEVEVDERCIIP